MTLVVGRVFQGRTYIFADTALTSSIAQSVNPFTEGCVKCYIVNDRIALAFADSMHAFEQVCGVLLAMRDASEIVNYAANAQKNVNQGAFELLVAEAGRDSLWFVKGGDIVQAAAGYLGEPSAFDAFQKYLNDPTLIPGSQPEETFELGFFRSPEPPIAGDIYRQMFDGFKAVIEDPRFNTVGGAILPLCTHNGRFQYLAYANVFSTLEKYGWNGQPIPFGTAADGGYAVELCTDEAGSELAFYFLQGEFGLFFPREESGFRRAVVVRTKNPAYFVLESSKLTGRQIQSGYASADHFGIAGDELLGIGRHEDALFCYELGNGVQLLQDRPRVLDHYVAQHAIALFRCGKQESALAMLDECMAMQPTDWSQCRLVRAQIT